MTEPVPGQTPDPAVADAATATPGEARQQPIGTPEPDATSAGPPSAEAEPTAAEPTAAEPTEGAPAANPQELFGSLSLAAIEADIDRLMNDKMSQLDGMLAGLEDLVQRLEGEITNLEPPPDGPATP
jgi:hypothetical protein